jgi:hypothetical protein
MDDNGDYVSSSHQKGGRPPKQVTVSKSLISVVVVVIVAIAGFVGGVQYEKGHVKTTATTATTTRGSSGGGTGGGFNRDGGIGTVTAVSSTSISISDQRTSSTKTYSISGNTTITDNGTTVTYSDITVGETVLVRTSSSTSTDATTIMVNPSFGGGQGGGAPTGTSSTSN